MDLTTRRLSDFITMQNMYDFEASFIPIAPGRTRVESRGTYAGRSHLIGEPMWRHIERCSAQLTQKK
jgi:hypothetical protein